MKYSICFILLCFLSCGKKDNSNPSPFLIKTDSIAIPLAEQATHQGHFIDNQQDLFYSYNINTNKLFIYNKKEVIDSLNLNKHKLTLNQILIKNLDSIFIIDYADRHIKHINIKGVVKNDIDFRKMSNQDSINPYLYKGQTIGEEMLLLSPVFSNAKYKNILHSELVKKHKSTPRFIYIKEDTIKYAPLNYFDIEKISGKDTTDISVDYSDLLITKNYIALTLEFNNQIYLFDKAANYIKSVSIASVYTGTDINTDYTFLNQVDRSELYKTNYDYATLTKFTAYNKVKNSIYLLLAHKTDISVEKNRIDKKNNRSFSILSYDEDFKKKNEQKFKKNRYRIYDPMYVDSKGNLLLNANNEMNPGYSPKHLQYDVYTEK